MTLLPTASIAALAMAGSLLSADLALTLPAASQSGPSRDHQHAPHPSHPCWLNQVQQRCTVTPVGDQGGFKVSFSAGDQPFFVFTPAGPATTDNRRMKDDQGRLWLYSGHHSFTLREQGGDRNVMSVQAD